jgi:hypothetical protein
MANPTSVRFRPRQRPPIEDQGKSTTIQESIVVFAPVQRHESAATFNPVDVEDSKFSQALTRFTQLTTDQKV